MKTLLIVAGAVAAYVIIGNVLHLRVFPLAPADPATFPRAGDVFASRAEGVEQEILDVSDGMARTRLTALPGAAGPPVHYHEAFDERIVVSEGTLHLEVAGEVHELAAGESFLVKAGVAHRPFNPTDVRAVVEDDAPTFPNSFAACLVQLYAVMDRDGTSPPHMMLQMSVVDPICDTHLAEVPAPVMTLMRVLLAPAARVAGYRNYYPEYALHAVPGDELRATEVVRTD